MKESQYLDFSLKTHLNNCRKGSLNSCNFDLTYGCGLNCNYCYSKCFDTSRHRTKELDFKKIKFILDKIYDAGILWLCLLGGDPLAREDFLEIYSYAKSKGFIVSIVTNAYSLTERIAKYLAGSPPFLIEMTLSGASEETVEQINGVKGSYKKIVNGIKLIKSNNLPLKIRIQLTKDNSHELTAMREFISNLDLQSEIRPFLQPRLNGDLYPCSLRLRPAELIKALGGGFFTPKKSFHFQEDKLFACVIGCSDGINIDPYGNAFLCRMIPNSVYNLLDNSVEDIMRELSLWIRSKKTNFDSKCLICRNKEFCFSCPGWAYAELGEFDKPISYYCELAEMLNKIQSDKYVSTQNEI